jgi:hypothetical protein
MSAQNKRNIFAINNKYQMKIVLLITAPLFVISMALLIAVYLMSEQIGSFLFQHAHSMIGPYIAQWFYGVVCFIFITLFTFMLLAFKVAYDLVNPFGRIILEMDEILITGAKRELVVRPEDELAKEVSDRINKLIAQIP